MAKQKVITFVPIIALATVIAVLLQLNGMFISMCNQMVTSEIKGSGNYKDLDKTCVKLFSNFTSIPFDYLLISWVTNYVSNLGFLTCLSWIVSIENARELHSLKGLDLKFGL